MKTKLLSLASPEQLKKDFKELGLAEKIASRYKVSIATVYNTFKILGINCKIRANAKNILTKDLLEIEYSELKSIRKVAEKLGVSHETIREYMHAFKININVVNKYTCDLDFFTRDNQESFYVAGFIAADGCLKERQLNHGNPIFQLYIGLAEKDKNILETIKQLMKSNHPISNFLNKNSKYNPLWNDSYKSEFTITSKKIFDDLKRFDIGPRKSMTYKFPEWMVTHPLKHHFMRGYNDGDGSFYIGNEEQIYFSLRGTPSFLEVFRSILEKSCDLTIRTTPIRVNTNQGVLEYGGNKILAKISQFLYKDATVFLPRKRDIIAHLL
jgi:hypothetical protein